MSARRLLPSHKQAQKRKRNSEQSYLYDGEDEPFSPNEIPNDTKAALDCLISLFQREKFGYKLPAIALKHQIYSILADRTLVDRELNSMRDAGEIQFFKLDSGIDEFAIVYMKDYVEHVAKCAESRGLGGNQDVQQFLKMLPKIKDVSIEKNTLINDLRISDDMISALMNLGVLITRDVNSWWVSIPGTALLMKNLIAGRKAIISLITKRKYKEILENECETKNINGQSKFCMKYLLHDVVGSGLVIKVPTTSGDLLRISDIKQAKRKRK